ncbi:substrate-binding domain-containing protein [Pseudomonas oryzihabitans]|uniref:substrate-binding domain-containing protein n=1 Tax=Pseudomonas oryzihabitans TaxID=47885 RepID=UPI000EF095E8|nr:substrate-binding domain-containing protein [Pseudomonas oryzihabitans]HCV75468.1 GntR family transcriptional regulator [Pseudomonas sp.]
MTDLKQVAQQAGVSRATAARAFATPEQVRESTRQRVLDAARSLNFRPNLLGRQLRQQSTRLIGVVVPSLLNPVFAEQLQAMERTARSQGYSLVIATTDYQPEREAAVVEELLRQRVAGLVLTVADADRSEVLAELSQEQTPFILAYHEPQRPYAAVAVDNRQGMAMATEHLLGLGHRRIALVSGPAQQSDRSERRFAGYCQAMAAAGLPTLPRLELASHTDADWTELAPLLERHAPTALLCTNDLLAISVIAELQRHGVPVPADLSVVGFDGIAMGARLEPSLCSVMQPLQSLGAVLVTELLALIAGSATHQQCLPCLVRPGTSAGPLKEPYR